MPIHNTKHSKESKVKMSIARKGKGLWLGETRNLPTGEKHHRWLGGKSCLAEKLRKGLRYKNWRKVVFERDDFTCHNCNKRGGRIEGHHIIEFVLLLDKYKINSQDEAYKCKQLWDISNGQTLCYKCHNLTKKGYGTRK